MWDLFQRRENNTDRIKRMLRSINVDLDSDFFSQNNCKKENWRSFIAGLVIGLGIGAFLGMYLGANRLQGRRY